MDSSQKGKIKELLRHLLYKDKKFFLLIATYAVIVTLLNLALPLSIQMLITSVIYTALITPVVVLGIILLFLLSFSALLGVLQKFLIEIYKQNNFARLSAEILLKAIYSDHTSFRSHNTSDLSSRYFEIFNIQRNASELIVEGFLIFLTILVSFTLSSFYHPYFLILNLLIIVCLWLSWGLFSKHAIKRAIERSERKFAVFAWIDDIFRMSTFFKAGKNKDYAITKGHKLISEYIIARKKYWHISFSQLIILTVIYVVVTILLITFGSILVIKGQLSLGQLVAAEILYTTSLYGISKLSIYYDKYYNLIASIDEMNHLYTVSNEEITNKTQGHEFANNVNVLTPIISFKNVGVKDGFATNYLINLEIHRNTSNLLLTSKQVFKELLVNLLTSLVPINSGLIEFKGIPISDINQHELRDRIIVINNPNMFGCTIGEFLNYAVTPAMIGKVNRILEIVDLNNSINNLPDRFNTHLVGDGYPLDEEHLILLKIAKAMLLEPDVIVITEIFDKLDKSRQQRILNYIRNQGKITLICFSENEDNHTQYDNFIFLSENETRIVKTHEEFRALLSKVTLRN